MVAGILSQNLSLGAGANPARTQLVFFGTYTGPKSQGIYLCEFDAETGQLGPAQLAVRTRNPTFLALDSTGRLIYAVNEIDDFGGRKSGAVSAFRLDPGTGRLTFINEQPSGGSGPCHLAVARNGKCLLVANYGSGSVAVLPLESDGRLDKPSASIQHHGSSINPQRQEGPHAHFITWDPENLRVLTCDLGLDRVLLYVLNPAKLDLTPNDPPFFDVKPGSGPRHLAFAPSGRFVYVLNEIASTLTCCSYEPQSGRVEEFQTASTLPEAFRSVNTCAEIQVHPSGKFIYASNRGHNSIAVFAVDQRTGRVRLVQNEPSGGKTPRHFSLDPTARWLLAENQDSDGVSVFSVEAASGRLAPAGISQQIGAPVCAVFVAKQ